MSVGYDFHGVDKPKNETSHYGLRYAEFVVPLVKAVQELSEINQEQNVLIEKLLVEQKKFKSELQQFATLKSEIEELKAEVAGIQAVSSDKMN